MLRLKTLTAAGDTIVEVLVVLAVLGLAIGLSYGTANRSLLATREAQENSEATDYVQSEIEDLRYLVPTTPQLFTQAAPFCITDPTSANPIVTNVNNCGVGSVPYVLQIYNCDSIVTNPCNPAIISNTSDTFVVQAKWPDVQGDGTDSATLSYRVHTP